MKALARRTAVLAMLAVVLPAALASRLAVPAIRGAATPHTPGSFVPISTPPVRSPCRHPPCATASDKATAGVDDTPILPALPGAIGPAVPMPQLAAVQPDSLTTALQVLLLGYEAAAVATLAAAATSTFQAIGPKPWAPKVMGWDGNTPNSAAAAAAATGGSVWGGADAAAGAASETQLRQLQLAQLVLSSDLRVREELYDSSDDVYFGTPDDQAARLAARLLDKLESAKASNSIGSNDGDDRSTSSNSSNSSSGGVEGSPCSHNSGDESTRETTSPDVVDTLEGLYEVDVYDPYGEYSWYENYDSLNYFNSFVAEEVVKADAAALEYSTDVDAAEGNVVESPSSSEAPLVRSSRRLMGPEPDLANLRPDGPRPELRRRSGPGAGSATEFGPGPRPLPQRDLVDRPKPDPRPAEVWVPGIVRVSKDGEGDVKVRVGPLGSIVTVNKDAPEKSNAANLPSSSPATAAVAAAATNPGAKIGTGALASAFGASTLPTSSSSSSSAPSSTFLRAGDSTSAFLPTATAAAAVAAATRTATAISEAAKPAGAAGSGLVADFKPQMQSQSQPQQDQKAGAFAGSSATRAAPEVQQQSSSGDGQEQAKPRVAVTVGPGGSLVRSISDSRGSLTTVGLGGLVRVATQK